MAAPEIPSLWQSGSVMWTAIVDAARADNPAPAGRYAPSPTSDLHLGNLRTALIAWLAARLDGLRFLLRIEDLDQARVHAAGDIARRQCDDLARLGLDWDDDPWVQSQRTEIYQAALDALETYRCLCSRKDIATASQAPHGYYRPYPGTCARLSAWEFEAKQQANPHRRPAIRVRAGQESKTICDLHAGSVTGTVDDFVVCRSDQVFAYNLAVVVDDGLSGVTQVVRGADLLESAPRQAWLASQLGLAEPSYIHVSLVMNQDGKRLAKRDGDTTLTDLRQQGDATGTIVARLASSLGLPPAPSPQALLEMTRNEGIASSADLGRVKEIWRPWIV